MIDDGQEEKGAGEDEAVHAFEGKVKGVKEDGRSGKEGEGVKEKVGSG